jgi:hypothetical protein
MKQTNNKMKTKKYFTHHQKKIKRHAFYVLRHKIKNRNKSKTVHEMLEGSLRSTKQKI